MAWPKNKEALAQLVREEYHRGFDSGMRAGKHAAHNDLSQAKLDALKAYTKLIEEQGRLMSRIGYGIGKITGKEGF